MSSLVDGSQPVASRLLLCSLGNYHIIAPNIHNTTDPNHDLMQDLDAIQHVPQGIPALYAFFERNVGDETMAQRNCE